MSNEEKVNTWTHLVPLIATLVIAYPLMAFAYQSQITNQKSQGAASHTIATWLILS